MLSASIHDYDNGTDGGDDESLKNNSIQNCVSFLENNEFIRLTNDDENQCTKYVATQLGLACLSSSLGPDEGLQVFQELKNARKCFVLENEMHLVYLVVPILDAIQWPNLDWMSYLNMYESLSPDIKHVAEIIGVEERFLVRAMRGTINIKLPKQVRLNIPFQSIIIYNTFILFL